MPGFFTDYMNNKILDLVIGNTPLTIPSTLYLGLSLTQASKGGIILEPLSTNGYSRCSVTNSILNFPAATNASKANSIRITFPLPVGPWGTVQSVFIADATTGGNVLAMADLTNSKSIGLGSSAPTIAPGALFFSHT